MPTVAAQNRRMKLSTQTKHRGHKRGTEKWTLGGLGGRGGKDKKEGNSNRDTTDDTKAPSRAWKRCRINASNSSGRQENDLETARRPYTGGEIAQACMRRHNQQLNLSTSWRHQGWMFTPIPILTTRFDVLQSRATDYRPQARVGG